MRKLKEIHEFKDKKFWLIMTFIIYFLRNYIKFIWLNLISVLFSSSSSKFEINRINSQFK